MKTLTTLSLAFSLVAFASCNKSSTSPTANTTPVSTPTNQPVVPPAIDSFENWATFRAKCSSRDDEVKALNKLLSFYNVPANTSVNADFTAPTGEFGQRVKDSHGERWTFPLGTIANVSISADDVAPNLPLKADVSAKVVMAEKRLMLLKTSEEQWYVSLDGNAVIPLIKEKEDLVLPTSSDRNKVFLQKWRISRFLKFRQEISNLSPTGSETVSPELGELLSELPIPESKSILLHIESKEVRDAALSQWQKTMDMINAKAAN